MVNSVGGQALIAHPLTPARAVEGVFHTLTWKSAGEWVLEFHVGAPIGALLLPAPVEPSRADELWQHTCCEFFLLNPADGSYIEFNFSPSGQWACYRFEAYRSGMMPLNVKPPHVSTSNPRQAMMALKAQWRSRGMDEESIERIGVGLPELPPSPNFHLRVEFEDPELRNRDVWRAGVSAVIEETDGTKSYWALAHPAAQPDFHNAAGYVLKLPAGKARTSRS